MRKGLLVLALVVAAAAVAGDRPLAAFVPDGAVFVARGLRLPHLARDLADTSLGRAVCQSPVARSLKESGRLAEFELKIKDAEAKLGFKVCEVLEKLAGEEVILAVYAGERPDRPWNVILMRGPDGEDAGAALDRVLSGLAKEKEIELLPSVPSGERELRRFRNKQGEEIVTLARGSRTLLSNSTDLAGKVIDLAAGRRADSILSNERLRRTCVDLVEYAHLSAFLDVEVALEALRGRVEHLPPPARRALRMVEAIEGIAVAASIHDNGITGRCRAAIDEGKLPDFFVRWHAEPEETSWFASYFPRDALIAGMAARIDFNGLVQAILAELPPPIKESAERHASGFDALFLGGKSLLKDLLPAIGPDVALVFSDVDQSDRVPGEATFLVKLRDESGKAILGSLVRSLFGLTQLGNQEEAARYTFTETEGAATLSRKDEDFTATLVVSPSAFIASSSLEMAKKAGEWLREPPPDPAVSAVPPFKLGFMGADLKALGRWFQRHGESLAELRARKEGAPVDETRRWIAATGEWLTTMDAFSIRGASRPGAFEIAFDLAIGQ